MSVVVAFAIFFSVSASAQSPRDYLNAPVDAAMLQLDFLNTNTQTASASDLPLPNSLAVSRIGSATMLWSFPLDGRYGGVAVNGGYIKVKATGPAGQTETMGFTDPGFTFHANIFDAPEFRRDQFAKAIPQSYMSVHLRYAHHPVLPATIDSCQDQEVRVMSGIISGPRPSEEVRLERIW